MIAQLCVFLEMQQTDKRGTKEIHPDSTLREGTPKTFNTPTPRTTCATAEVNTGQ